jgi:outer membrane protein OmpA-like peptidoglycan-associated protein
VQRQARASGGWAAPPVVHEVIRSPGRPLDPSVRTELEGRLGHDFSQVRIHTDAVAAASARAVGALAYTVGRDVVFDADRYAPATGEGMRLLAHELVHVKQQASFGAVDTTGLLVAPADDRSEVEAAAVSGPVVQRQPSSEEKTKPPLIPMPVFDEFDPMVIAPDMPGVPDFLKGQQVKLSDLRKALEVFGGNVPSLSGGGDGDFCARILPGYETVNTGPFSGMCCPKFAPREKTRCCPTSRIGLMDQRCCGPDEVVIQGRCVRPAPAPAPKPSPVPSPGPAPGPAPPPGPTPAPKTRATPIFPFPTFRLPSIKSSTIDHFDSDSAALPSGVSDQLDSLAAEIKANPDAIVHVDGHTDSRNTPEYNQPLSDKRAAAVRDALVERGVPSSRIVVKGYSELRLLFRPEHDDEERARNRRVEVWMLISPTSLGAGR